MIWDNEKIGNLLKPVTWPYEKAVKVRNKKYDTKEDAVHQLNAKVISVGNITVGGTGKSPLVIWLAEQLQKMGKKVVILSRGYKRKIKVPVIVSDGEQIFISPQNAGDEPAMMARRLWGVPIVVGSDRVWIGQWAEGLYHPDVFILDDAYQHRRLHRDLDIVVINQQNPWGNGQLIPAGPLREPKSSLSRADIILLSHVENEVKNKCLQKEIKAMTEAPILSSYHQPCCFVSVKDNCEISLDALNSKDILAFTGIGNPLAFFTMLLNLKLSLKGSETFGDHYWFKDRDIQSLVQKAKDADAQIVITTEKDAVRITDWPHDEIPLYFMRIEMEIDQPENYLIPMLQNLFEKE